MVVVLLGTILFENAGKVNWTDVRESVPIFLITALVPFTYSLLYGVFFGLCMYLVFKVFSLKFWKKYAPGYVYSVVAKIASWFSADLSDDNRPAGPRIVNGVFQEDWADDEEHPLLFDNPAFDFETQKSHVMERSSSAGSDFFGLSYGGIGMGPLNTSQSDDYLNIYDAVGEDESSHDIILSSSKSKDWDLSTGESK